MPPLEQPRLTIGFIPLTDCAPLVIAKERGFFAAEGLDVTLVREAAWASIRDKLSFAALDLAHMLAPMPIAMTLGLGHRPRATVAPLTIGLNGNAFTIGAALFDELAAIDPMVTRPPAHATGLAEIVARRRRAGQPRLTFATVFPFSCHHYQLRYWLTAGGLDPAQDVEIVSVPPPQMVAQLEAGRIDGFCVGAPWNLVAVRRGFGRIVVTGYDIWNNATEKVLGARADWAAERPLTLAAVMRALVRAGAWLDRLENRLEAASILGDEAHVGVPAHIIGLPLMGLIADGISAAPRSLPDFHVFHRYAAAIPRLDHAAWLVRAMRQAGQLPDLPTAASLQAIFPQAPARAVLADLGLPIPPETLAPLGGRATVEALATSAGPLALGPDRFCDGAIFDPTLPLRAPAALHKQAAL